MIPNCAQNLGRNRSFKPQQDHWATVGTVAATHSIWKQSLCRQNTRQGIVSTITVRSSNTSQILMPTAVYTVLTVYTLTRTTTNDGLKQSTTKIWFIQIKPIWGWNMLYTKSKLGKCPNTFLGWILNKISVMKGITKTISDNKICYCKPSLCKIRFFVWIYYSAKYA